MGRSRKVDGIPLAEIAVFFIFFPKVDGDCVIIRGRESFHFRTVIRAVTIGHSISSMFGP